MLVPVIVPGMPRSGTTALYRYLAAHPEVCGSIRKEVDFFVRDGLGDNLDSVRARYRASFPEPQPEHRLTLEASPAYSRAPAQAAERIARVLPHARILFVFRDPASRFHTYFRAEKERNQRITRGLSFDRFVEIALGAEGLTEINRNPETAQFIVGGLKVGQYAEVLEPFLDAFGPDAVDVVFSDDLSRRPDLTLGWVAERLGIDPGFYRDFEFTSENRSKSVRRAWLYQLALKTNVWAEPVLNRMPAVRELARKAHGALNETKTAVPVSETARAALEAHYAPHMAAFRDLLETRLGVERFPVWLQSDWGRQDAAGVIPLDPPGGAAIVPSDSVPAPETAAS